MAHKTRHRVTIMAKDALGRIVAEVSFRPTWRYNEVIDQRDMGYRIDYNKPGFGHDFGDADFFITPPMGSAQGIIVAKQKWNAVA